MSTISDERVQCLLEQVKDNLISTISIVEALSKYTPHPASIESIERIARLGFHESVNILAILTALEASGFCRQETSGLWVSEMDTKEVEMLSIILKGADLYQRIHVDRDKVQMVVTLPEYPSKFTEVLLEQGLCVATLKATDSAFFKIARNAHSRLVIVTPFIDRTGAEFLMNLFQITTDKPMERILIVRDYHAVKSFLIPFSGLIESLCIKIFDYLIYHEDGTLPYETFHAKIILGDHNQAYIGSANLLASSLELAFEMGVLINGKSVLDVRRLIDSIIVVSRQMM